MYLFHHERLYGAALAAGFSLALSPASAVTVDLDGLALSSGEVIELEKPGFGGVAPVTLNWAPPHGTGTELRFWNGNYSGRDAAFCVSGIDCALDLTVASGFSVTLDSFWLGTYPDTDRMITWSVTDLFDGSVVASAFDAFVSGASGLRNFIGATSPVGFRILFGPDGNNGGINDIVYSFAAITDPTDPVDPVDPGDPSVIPLPATAWLLLAGLGGLGAVRRRA